MQNKRSAEYWMFTRFKSVWLVYRLSKNGEKPIKQKQCVLSGTALDSDDHNSDDFENKKREYLRRVKKW